MKKSLSYFVLAVSICTASLLQQQKLIQLPLSTNDPPTIILPPIIIRPATEPIQVAWLHTFYREEYPNSKLTSV